MKVVILAGGLGTRLAEETDIIPKPMVEIGGKPILWHIMKTYSTYGFTDFIICLGYKGYMIKEYFSNYFLHQSDVTIDVKNNNVQIHKNVSEPWKITLVDTGLDAMTADRIKKIKPYVGNETFMLTYGDGVGSIDINKLLKFHKTHKRHVTLTAVQLRGRFGAMEIDSKNNITDFCEKPKGDRGWINGGFFVLEPQIFNYIKGNNVMWEKGPLKKLAQDNQLRAYKYKDFWMCMDTLRDRRELENLWASGSAPWKVWKD